MHFSHPLNLKNTSWYRNLDPEAEKFEYPTVEKLQEHMEAGGIEVEGMAAHGMGHYLLVSPDDSEEVEAVWAMYSGEVVFENADIAILKDFLKLTPDDVALSHGKIVAAVQSLIRLVVPGAKA